MDIRAIVHAINLKPQAFIWLIATILIGMASLRIIFTLTTASAVLIELPAAPQPLKTAQSAITPNVLLFTEKNAWSPYAVGEIAPDDEQLRHAPRSTLPVKVVGILHHRSAQHSQAILAGNQQQFTVSVHDALPNHPAQVMRIFIDRVIVQHRGHYESLLLESDGQ